MQPVPINYFAVLLAGIVSMPLGFLWYGPLFGKKWMKLSGMSKEKIDAAKKSGKANMGYGLMFVGSLVMAYVLAHSLVFASSYLRMTGVPAGLMSGFWSWLGFVGPVTLGSVLWDGKPWMLSVLNNTYYILLLLLMGVILALM